MKDTFASIATGFSAGLISAELGYSPVFGLAIAVPIYCIVFTYVEIKKAKT